MRFYNVLQGDMPYFRELADRYTMSDDYHRPATGEPRLTASSPASAMRCGVPSARATPPANEIEYPNPLSGTNNNHTQDGDSGGSYGACADTSQPGVSDVVSSGNLCLTRSRRIAIRRIAGTGSRLGGAR